MHYICRQIELKSLTVFLHTVETRNHVKCIPTPRLRAKSSRFKRKQTVFSRYVNKMLVYRELFPVILLFIDRYMETNII